MLFFSLFLSPACTWAYNLFIPNLSSAKSRFVGNLTGCCGKRERLVYCDSCFFVLAVILSSPPKIQIWRVLLWPNKHSYASAEDIIGLLRSCCGLSIVLLHPAVLASIINFAYLISGFEKNIWLSNDNNQFLNSERNRFHSCADIVIRYMQIQLWFVEKLFEIQKNT